MSEWFPVSAGVAKVASCPRDVSRVNRLDCRSHSHRGFFGITVGHEIFTDIDFDDDLSILAEMLEVIILALEILREKSFQLALEINWNKTNMQATESLHGATSMVPVLGHQAEMVYSFIYLGSCNEPGGESDMDIRRRIELVRTCMKALNREIWRQFISLSTKFRLYSVYILPVLTEPTHGV